MELVRRERAPAGARLLTDALTETLILDHEGRVVGVMSADGGEEPCVRTRRGVILTAGGYVLNKGWSRARRA